MFTVKSIESLKQKDKPYRVYEKSARAGFGVQVSPKGTKTFFYGYRFKVDGKHKQRFMKLGHVGSVSLKQAGELWQKAYNLKQSGLDPQTLRDSEARKAEEENQKALELKKSLLKQGTYEQLLAGYIDDLRANKKRSADNIEQVFKSNAYKKISRSAKARDITPEQIDNTIGVIEKRGRAVMVNRMRSYLSAAFSYGIRSDKKRATVRNQILFGITSNPVRDVLKSDIPERVGNRYLSESEVKTLWETLDDTDFHIKTVTALKLLLAMGQRVEEILRININDIDIESRLWELEKTKNKRPHVVVLPEVALELIKGIEADKDGFIFKNKKGTGLMKSDVLAHACSKYCKGKEFKRFTPRDLRRTWKTLAGKAGITKENRDHYQNHSGGDVSSKHYDRYDYLAEKRQVAITWNAYLNGILFDGEASVIAFKAKA